MNRIALALSLAMLAFATARAANNGPCACGLCLNAEGTSNVDCRGDTINSVSTLNTALTPPAANFDSGGNSSLEFAWADGDQRANLLKSGERLPPKESTPLLTSPHERRGPSGGGSVLA